MSFGTGGSLPNESVCITMDADDRSQPRLVHPVNDNVCVPAALMVTYYRVIVTPCPKAIGPHYGKPRPLEIPIMMIESCQLHSSPSNSGIHIQTKHVWSVRVSFFGEGRTHIAAQVIKVLEQMRPTALNMLPAFSIRSNRDESRSHDQYGWFLYDIRYELQRQTCLNPSAPVADSADANSAGIGRDLRPWFRISSMKQPDNAFGKSPTYPFRIVAPMSISDAHLVGCMDERSRGRIPHISYVHLGTGAVLARSSQPNTKSAQVYDGRLCDALIVNYTIATARPPELERQPTAVHQTAQSFRPPPSLVEDEEDPPPMGTGDVGTHPTTGSSVKVLQCCDCRPRNSAYANIAMGGGFESGPAYSSCRVKFHGIPNIFGISSAFGKLREIVSGQNGRNSRSDFFALLNESQWLHLIQRVLVAATEVAESLQQGTSTLVHCTDGWDRTAQVLTLAMIMLDPYYRTIRGLEIIVEREFCEMGHKFAERSGHRLPGEYSSGMDESHGPQVSPIFIQWLDVLHQLVVQFPNYFEYTERLLAYLSIHVFSCYYGTFLCDNVRSRTWNKLQILTLSVWDAVEEMANAERSGSAPFSFINPFFRAEEALEYIVRKRNHGIWPIVPMSSLKRIVLWEKLYFAYDSDEWLMDRHPEDSKTSPIAPEKSPACAEAFLQWLEEGRVRAIERAVDERSRLQELVVDVPPASEEPLATKIDDKSCGQCKRPFGFFSAKVVCTMCPESERVPLCSDCSVSASGKKLCLRCRELVAQ